jgi:DNA-binding transcriptional regulator YhcF (GntR family)
VRGLPSLQGRGWGGSAEGGRNSKAGSRLAALACPPPAPPFQGVEGKLDCGTVLAHYSAVSEERPVYLRLRDNIAAMILEGRVGDGDPLPSVRSLAAEFGANPLTVAKAYQTFQDEGLVLVRRGVGMFVAQGATDRLRKIGRDDFLNHRWPEIAAQIRRLGLSAEELLERIPA